MQESLKNCFSQQAGAFDYGDPFTEETQDHIIELLKPKYIEELTVLGDEPMEPENQVGLLPFLRQEKQEFLEKTIWIYTGFMYEELMGKTGGNISELREILKVIDGLVDVVLLKNSRICVCDFVAHPTSGS